MFSSDPPPQIAFEDFKTLSRFIFFKNKTISHPSSKFMVTSRDPPFYKLPRQRTQQMQSVGTWNVHDGNELFHTYYYIIYFPFQGENLECQKLLGEAKKVKVNNGRIHILVQSWSFKL